MQDRKYGIAISYANSLLSIISGVLLSVFLVRVLGQTEYGLYQVVCSFANYLILFEFGTGTVMTRNISKLRATGKSEELQKHYSTISIINLFMIMLVVIVAGLFYSVIDDIYVNTLSHKQIIYVKKIFVFESLYLISSIYTNMLNGIIIGLERYLSIPVLAMIKTLLRTICVILFVIGYKYALSIVIVDFVIGTLFSIIILCYCHKSLNVSFNIKYFDKNIFKEALPFCLAVMIQGVVNQANNSVDKFIIGIMMPPDIVTVYSVGLYIFSVFSSLTTIPLSMFAPQIISKVVQGMENTELTHFLVKPARFIAFVGWNIIGLFFSCGRDFISILYGTEFLIAWKIALIIMVPMMLNMTTGVIVSVLDARNKRMVRSLILMFTTCINVILTIFFIKVYGIVGACIATAIATLLGQVLFMNIYYKKRMGVNATYIILKAYEGVLWIVVVSSGLAFTISSTIENQFIGLVTGGGIYTVVFVALFFSKIENRQEIFNILQKNNKS